MQASVEVHDALPKTVLSPPRNTDDATMCKEVSLSGHGAGSSSRKMQGTCSWSWHIAGRERESLHQERTTYAGQRDSL